MSCVPADRIDIINHEKTYSAGIHVNENAPEKPLSHPTFSMIGSIQSLFQRLIKASPPSSPSSSSSSQSPPSTPNLSQPSDQNPFRVRPFPMSSYEPDSATINPSNQRFYHVFKHGELELLIEEAGKSISGTRILHSYYDHGNWCAVVQRDDE